jgi:hypothetical protein
MGINIKAITLLLEALDFLWEIRSSADAIAPPLFLHF